MSIKAVRLRNFRGFEKVGLELKPLTVLLGPNSSGKSSFSHSLAALSHCQRLYSGRRDASLTPENPARANDWPIDLGGYKDLVTRGSNEKVSIELFTSEGWVDFGFGLVPTAPDELWLSQLGYPQALLSPATTQVTAVTDAAALRELQERDPLSIVDLGQGTNVSLQVPDETRLVLERINEQEWQLRGNTVVLGLDGLVPLNLQRESAERESGTEISFNRKATSEVRSFLQNLTYLRASRKRPTRGYERFRSERRSLGYAGEKTASVLLNRSGVEVFALPPELGKDLRLEWRERETTLQLAVGEWLRHFGLGYSVESRESERYGAEYIDLRVGFRPGATRDITEVGYALSQTLPVIVAALLQSRDSLFVVDLPEAHLHPRPQGEMADLFCALAIRGISTLVETHSEMFFHRLRLRAAMDPELMKQIAVYFLDPPRENGICATPRKIGLSFEEELKWPPGFLQETLDSEVQIDSVRQNRLRHG
jgi:predicted ATPase